MSLCYTYILAIIFVSGRMIKLKISRRLSRKFLHAMIGNLSFIIPFFTYNKFPLNFPFFVAAPFIILTFLVSPYSPYKGVAGRFRELVDITGEGHHLGLFLYAISYTLLALFFASKPHVMAVGVLPMAYGDAAASAVGEKWGRRRYKILSSKSLEGSAAMLLVTFTSLMISTAYYSMFNSILPIIDQSLVYLIVAIVASVVEGFSPSGFDNLTVPLSTVLVYLRLTGGF
ncbi:MAG: phosphatidate cytidylyltransferase [Thermoproteota archaeon]